jgi:peptidoglycan/xylan/chitin deacetylase (PgdA/CDA1 family)
MRLASLIVGVWLVGCGMDYRGGRIQYRWDKAPVICSKAVDDLTGDTGLVRTGAELDYAVSHRTAAPFHAHVPLTSVSLGQLDCIMALAQEKGVEMVTFSDLAAGGTPRPALALAFDDDGIDAWYAVRRIFEARNARVTFFVTNFVAWTDTQKAKLAELAALGHDVQAHGMYHLNAVNYVAANSMDDYLQKEVLPSIALLEQAGYPINTYAFPGGATNDEINDAVLEYVPHVRVTRSECPY